MAHQHRIIALTGPESTGKTTLAESLSAQMKLPLVEDVSRQYIANLNRPYTEADVLQIGRDIINEERQMMSKAHTFISDNCLVNILIWLRYYRWAVPTWLENELAENRATHFYLLCNTDLPWVQDEQRQNPHDRLLLFDQFKHEIEEKALNYVFISGFEPERTHTAHRLVSDLLDL